MKTRAQKEVTKLLSELIDIFGSSSVFKCHRILSFLGGWDAE